MKNQRSGTSAFENFYQAIYQERWPVLKAALLQDVKHVALAHPLASVSSDWQRDMHLPHVYHPTASDEKFYYLDYASVFAAWALAVKPNETVLDLCAAPGGKSLFLAMELAGQGELICNDRSPERRGRLKNVMEQFLPAQYHAIVSVFGRDGRLWGLHEPNRFDKILLDAPCSSERHVLKSPKHLEQWKISRTKKCAKDQGSLLCSAFEALKFGGRMVYSTCSLSPYENDELMEWFEKKRQGLFDFKRLEIPVGESTQYGHIFLPDQTGYGPLYLSIIEKHHEGTL